MQLSSEPGAQQSGSPSGKWPGTPPRITLRAEREDAEKSVVQARWLVSQAVSPTRIWLTRPYSKILSCLIILTTVLKSVSTEKHGFFPKIGTNSFGSKT